MTQEIHGCTNPQTGKPEAVWCGRRLVGCWDPATGKPRVVIPSTSSGCRGDKQELYEWCSTNYNIADVDGHPRITIGGTNYDGEWSFNWQTEVCSAVFTGLPCCKPLTYTHCGVQYDITEVDGHPTITIEGTTYTGTWVEDENHDCTAVFTGLPCCKPSTYTHCGVQYDITEVDGDPTITIGGTTYTGTWVNCVAVFEDLPDCACECELCSADADAKTVTFSGLVGCNAHGTAVANYLNGRAIVLSDKICSPMYWQLYCRWSTTLVIDGQSFEIVLFLDDDGWWYVAIWGHLTDVFASAFIPVSLPVDCQALSGILQNVQTSSDCDSIKICYGGQVSVS